MGRLEAGGSCFEPDGGHHLPDCRRIPGCEDRRRLHRVLRNLAISYRAGGIRWTRTRALNLSAHGARVLTFEPVERGHNTQLRLEIAPDWLPQVLAEPIWCQRVGNRAFIVGFQFKAIHPEDQSRLSAWVCRELLADFHL